MQPPVEELYSRRSRPDLGMCPRVLASTGPSRPPGCQAAGLRTEHEYWVREPEMLLDSQISWAHVLPSRYDGDKPVRCAWHREELVAKVRT